MSFNDLSSSSRRGGGGVSGNGFGSTDPSLPRSSNINNGSSGQQPMPAAQQLASRHAEAEFRSLADSCISSIFQISNNVAALQKMVNQIGHASKDTGKMRERLHEVQENTRRMAKETARHIREMGQAIEEGASSGGGGGYNSGAGMMTGGGPGQEALRQRRIQQQKISKDFAAVLRKFEQIQKVAASRERETVTRARRSLSQRSMEDDPMLDLGHGGNQERMGLLSEHEEQQEQHQIHISEDQIIHEESIIQEREEGIRYIESTLNDVNEIFKDLSTVVHEQGGMLDNIESNIVNVRGHVAEGAEQLQKASQYQRKSRNKMCVLLLVLTVIAAVLALVIYMTR